MDIMNPNPNASKASSAEAVTKVQAKIKSTWNKLSDDDIKLYASSRPEFLAKLKEKQNVSNEDAEKHLKEFEKSCGCGSSGDTTKAA
jgi:hypothetical protein